jgi:putative transposase
MTRPIRIEFPGAVYHIAARGNDRRPIFRDDWDRKLFLDVLARAVARWNWICHAYCLMGNHYHLVVETPEPTLSRGMRQVNGEYTQAFNRRHGRSGHLFQGRFHAVLVEKESHLLEVCRYVVLNPVRVRGTKVGNPGAWPWSSYRATAGEAAAPPFLTVGWLLGRLGRGTKSSQRGYRQFVASGLEGAGRDEMEIRKGLWIGSAEYIGVIEHHLDEKRGVPEYRKQERTASRLALPEFFPHEAIQDKALRNAGIGRAYFEGRYSQGEIARHLGLHLVTVGRIARFYEHEKR